MKYEAAFHATPPTLHKHVGRTRGSMSSTASASARVGNLVDTPTWRSILPPGGLAAWQANHATRRLSATSTVAALKGN
jgi:hypothetical protein